MGSTRSGKASREGRRDPLAGHREALLATQEVYRRHGLRLLPETAQQLREVGVEPSVEAHPADWQDGLAGDTDECPPRT